MHYIPESTAEMLQGNTPCASTARANFHYQSAPLYFLTFIVGVLMVADWSLSLGLATAKTGTVAVPSLWGYRLALLAAVLGGARILYHTLDGLLSGRFGADLALTLACLAAIALGELQTAGLVVLISLIGESIEGYTIDRARGALQRTFAVWPEIAHRQEDGREQDIPVQDVRVGDIVVVRPGERVPVDGQVVAGLSVVDQSPFTGESVPIDKQRGDKVLAGTQNQFGALIVVAESIGQDTALARIAQLVGEATNRKANLEKTADRLAKWFLPTVLAAAGLTLFGWRITTGSWQNGYLPALGVLVVACPCPLVLATPCAAMASLAWLARRGVVVKGSAVLERLAEIDTFAFDKTGTLTQGVLALGEIVPMSGLSQNEILRVAAIAERNSEHALARILVSAAEERRLSLPPVLEFESLVGAGVIAKILKRELPVDSMAQEWEDEEDADDAESDETESRTIPVESTVNDDNSIASIVVGNRRALDHGAIEFSHDVALMLKEREIAGESALVVAIDGTVVGIIGTRETIRPESRRVLDELHEIGITQFALLTGDRPQPADSVVKSLGLFGHVATEQLPADKANWVETARRGGAKVAMVGDGINDAPALAAANVGLALGRAGGDLAAAAGDIILLGDPLRPLPGLVRLSRALVQNIWQSILLFAFGLNGLGVLACSFKWLDPIGGALFHEIASLAVMANAMRLLWFEAWSSSVASHWMNRNLLVLDWIAENASPSKWVFWGIKHWKFGVGLACPFLLAAWLLSNVVLLTPDEQAVVTRFGQYKTTLTAGLHWRWPGPFEQITRSKTKLIQNVEIGYRKRPKASVKSSPNGPHFRRWGDSLRGSDAASLKSAQPSFGMSPSLPVIEWTATHEDREHTALTEESLTMTADEVPVELTAEVQYRIHDLKTFLFAGSTRPNEILRAAAESVLREVAASTTLDDLLTEQRGELERKSLAKLHERIKRYGLGIELLELQWLDVHPPQAVVPSYRQVADAMEDREQIINDAESYASSTLLAAVGHEALSLLQSVAQQQSPDVPNSQTRTDWKLNDSLWQRLVERNREEHTRLAGSAAAILFEGETARIQHESTADGISKRFERLFGEYQQSPTLTSQHLYWKILSEILSKQSLTIVDPSVGGRGHLWMGDPQLRMLPSPAIELRDQQPTNR